MSDTVYGTNNKRVVLLLLSFVLLASCCLFGSLDIMSVSADEDSYDFHLENGYGFYYEGDCIYTSIDFLGRIYYTCAFVYNDFGTCDFSSIPKDDIIISAIDCVPFQYGSDVASRDDYSFRITFDSPLVFHYSEVGCGANTWSFSYKDGDISSISLFLPFYFRGLVSGLSEPLDLVDTGTIRFNPIANIDFPCCLSLCTSDFSSFYADYSFGSAVNVSFCDMDSIEISSDWCFYGDYATIPTAPTYEGYDFIGWVPSVSGLNVSDPITCDVTFTATYSIKQYSVVVKDYNGSIISSSIVDYGSSFNSDYVPNRVGYTFIGYSSSSGYALGSPVYEDIVLVANYEINKYSVVFKDYDGSVIRSSVVDYGSSVVAPNNPSLIGHTFSGWKCSNIAYGVGSAVDCDLEFIATYTLNRYLISFYDYDNRLLSSVNVSFGYRINSSDIPNISRVGYTFDGWSSSVDGFTTSDIVYCDIDFTAKYTIITEFWQGYEYAKDENYSNGYDDGYLTGKDDFYSSGYDDGYSSGYGVGFSEGESSAMSSKDTFASLMYSIIDAPFNVLSNAFSFEIFGINLSYFLISIVSLLLVTVVIKKLI